jgi:hypothetical protein
MLQEPSDAAVKKAAAPAGPSASQQQHKPSSSAATAVHPAARPRPAAQRLAGPSASNERPSSYLQLRHPFASNIPDLFLREHLLHVSTPPGSLDAAAHRRPAEEQRLMQRAAQLRAQLNWEAISMGCVLEHFYPRKYAPGMSPFDSALQTATDGVTYGAAAGALLREAQHHMEQQEQQEQQGGLVEDWEDVARQQGQQCTWSQSVQHQITGRQIADLVRQQAELAAAAEEEEEDGSDTEVEEAIEDVSDADADEDDMHYDHQPSITRQIVGSVVYGYWSKCPYG